MKSLRMLIVALIFGWAQIAPHAVFASGPSNAPTLADRDKDPEQYYRDIGRDDIAKKYSARRSTQSAGIALVVVGALLLPLSFLAFGAENFDNETPDNTGAFFFLGIGALVLGSGIYLVTLPDDPLSPEEHRMLEQEATAWRIPPFGLEFRF